MGTPCWDGIFMPFIWIVFLYILVHDGWGHYDGNVEGWDFTLGFVKNKFKSSVWPKTDQQIYQFNNKDSQSKLT